MKRSTYFPGCILIFALVPLYVSAQLTPQQKTAINNYIESKPELAKYEKSIRDKVLADPTVGSNVTSCWAHLKKFTTLRNSRKLEDLRNMYSELGSGVPEIRNNILPDFRRLDYVSMLEQRPGNDILLEAKPHQALINYFSRGRHDKLDPKNAFGSMIILRPELVEELRKAATANLGKQADDSRLTLWLEIEYWNKMRQDAIKQIGIEENTISKVLDPCLSAITAKFAEYEEKENTVEQDWNGIFTTPSMTLKFERKGEFAFASADKSQGSATETVQWNLTIRGSNGDGRWTVVYVDNDKIITRGGSVKTKLEGDRMDYEIIGDEWNIKWNEGVKPYATETKVGTIGMKEKYWLMRKK